MRRGHSHQLVGPYQFQEPEEVAGSVGSSSPREKQSPCSLVLLGSLSSATSLEVPSAALQAPQEEEKEESHQEAIAALQVSWWVGAVRVWTLCGCSLQQTFL